MRVYYHTYPTCPQCHEPHAGGSPLEEWEDCIHCPSCGAHFYRSVDLVSSGRFPRTIEILSNAEGCEVLNHLKNMPLVWRINPNPVEREYVSWVTQAEKGVYLITWPWKDVRFVPVLVSEFLISRPKSKAVVIGEVSKEESGGLIEFPAVDDVFRNLVFIDSPKTDFEDLKTEINRFNRKMVFKKVKVVNCVIKETKGKNQREFICTETIRKCKNSIIKELEETFGKDAVRIVKWKKLDAQKWREDALNEDGFVDIVLEERQQYSAKNLRYRSQWLWEVLLNSRKIKRPSRIIKYTTVRGKDDLKNSASARLFFISAEIDPGDIFRMVSSINPDLVVIQNVDDFIKDMVLNGSKSMKFINFLNEPPESVVLMFSTNQEARYLYGINYPSEFSIFDLGVIPHTWDCAPVVERVKALGSGDSTYPSPVSSNIQDLPDQRGIPEVEFIESESISSLEEAVKEVENIFQGDMGRDMIKFLRDMLKSPVHPANLRRKGKLTGHILTFDYIMTQIYNIHGEEKANEINSIVKSVYGSEPEIGSPIMEKILEKANELLKKEDCTIGVVVHSHDVRATRKILKTLITGSCDRLVVCSWIDLPEILRSKSSGDVCLISTVTPPYLFTLSAPRIQKIAFIGGKKFIETVTKLVKNRLDENLRKPLYILSKDESAPPLLKKIQKELDLSSNQEILDLAEEFMFELDSGIQVSTPQYGYPSYPLTLEPGEKALLVVDFDGRGAFIPPNSSLLVVSENELAEINTSEIMEKSRSSTLIGKELMLDRQGLYFSFRSDFIRLMMEHGERAVFRRGPYIWNGFDELLKDALQWILLLQMAVENYSEQMKIPHEDTERKISEYLASLDLTAKNPEYIKKWWNDFEIVFTRKGPVPVFRIEHPRSLKDLEKIYAGLSELIPDLEIDLEDARRCYAASIMIQSFRRLLVKGKIKDVSPTLRILYRKIEREIKKILENSEKFRVSLVYTVEILREVHPFRVMENFKDYCRFMD
ncbi:hypothetical protein Asulf_01358 [Archaeoglobus sulfaticallidus PM70-1]|uniref:Uncharacterized protein n=1 Tax=Archaeoglobus sulfaticallidus PM70-1 TaxID=387631 RepID=N0BCL0_9EURY|nr:hypothetical protein [Archaeoglobus sulfaticallidus]AGK61349.1 hypothetical protein Asulf_01358 [Archaeoglobus sulfaticallidus PM70-1]